MPTDVNPDRSGDKQNIRVLMVGPDRSVHGGISGVVNNLYDAGLDKKVDLSYIGTMKEGSKVKKLLVAAKAYIRFLLKVKNTDVVHVHVASDNSFLRKSVFINKAAKCGKKIIIHQHGGEWKDYYQKLSENKKANVRDVFSKADRFLVLSPYYKDFFEKTVGIRDVTVFPDTIKLHEEPERTYGGHRILFLGRICAEKGVNELIDSVVGLREEFPDIELCLAGIWTDEGLRTKALKYGEFIRHVGWVNDKEKLKLISENDIFALPSYFEGQSVAILEAMDGCMCVVASDIGGIPMMVKDGETGILVKPCDTESLKDGLRKALKDPDLQRRLSLNGRRMVKEKFDIARTVDELKDMYEELVNG